METIQTIYHETTLIINHMNTITIIDPVITPGIEKFFQTYKETIFSHHIEKILKIQIQKVKTTEVEHQRQNNHVQSTEETHSDPPAIDKTERSEFQLNHIPCETTDDESETENTLLINMLHIKKDHKTSIDSNYYQNSVSNFIPKNQIIIKTQNVILHTLLKLF